MTTIVHSEIVASEPTGPDGRRWVSEVHLDSTGAETRILYLAEPGWDAASALAARASGLPDVLTDGELAALLTAIEEGTS